MLSAGTLCGSCRLIAGLVHNKAGSAFNQHLLTGHLFLSPPEA